MNLARLEEISRIATQECSVTLSRILHGPVTVGVHYVERKKVTEIFGMLELETTVVVVTHHLVGEVGGSLGLILPASTALLLAEVLLKKEQRTLRELTEEAKDTLEELGNIMIGNYLRAFSRQIGASNIVHRAGTLAWGTVGTVRDQIVNSLDTLEEGTIVGVFFRFEHATVKGYVVILFEAELLAKKGGALA